MKLGFCLLLPALILHAQQPAGDLCIVAGRVVSAARGEPVRNARLVLRYTGNPAGGSGSPAAYTTLTDDRGRFAMQGIQPGKYEFSAERVGFANSNYGACRPGRPGMTLSLDAGQQLTRVLFRLTPQAVITGRILDQDGDPLEGVQVRTVRYAYVMGKRQLMPSGYAGADDLGEYRLFGLAPGRYYLEATYQGMRMSMSPRPAPKSAEEAYVPTFYPGTADVAAAASIELAPGAQVRGLDFSLVKGRTVRLRGRVIAPPRVHVQSVMVQVMPHGLLGWDYMRGARVLDSQGTFEVADIRPGSYTLAAWLPDGKVNWSARQSVDLSAGSLENLVLNLSPGAEVTGQVLFEGQPPPALTGISVILHGSYYDEARFGPEPDGEVKQDGSFTVSNISSDTYQVRAGGLPEGYFLKSVRIGDDELKDAGIDATKGPPGPLLLTVSDQAGQVEGVVRNARQEPVPGANVVLVPAPKKRDRPEAFEYMNSDQHGRFLMKSVEPGEYKLFAWEDMEPGDYMDPDFLKPVEDRGRPVSIREGSRENAELQLIPAAPVPK